MPAAKSRAHVQQLRHLRPAFHQCVHKVFGSVGPHLGPIQGHCPSFTGLRQLQHKRKQVGQAGRWSLRKSEMLRSPVAPGGHPDAEPSQQHLDPPPALSSDKPMSASHNFRGRAPRTATPALLPSRIPATGNLALRWPNAQLSDEWPTSCGTRVTRMIIE